MALESLGRFDEAIADYKAVLAVAPDDPAAWNNLGNAEAGSGDWASAAEHYGKAAQLAPQFSFARVRALLAGGSSVAGCRSCRAAACAACSAPVHPPPVPSATVRLITCRPAVPWLCTSWETTTRPSRSGGELTAPGGCRMFLAWYRA